MTGPTSRRSAAATASRRSGPAPADPRALPQGPGDAAKPFAGRSRGRDGRVSLPTLRRRLAAIASRQAKVGLETPTEHSLVRRFLRRYSRARGTAVRKKEPLLIEQLPAILMAMPDDELACAIGRCCCLAMPGRFGAASSWRSTSSGCGSQGRGATSGSRARRTTPEKTGASSSSHGCQRRQSNRSFASSRRSSAGLRSSAQRGRYFERSI